MSALAVGVNVVIADHDWILQRLADELAARLDYVTVSDRPDPAAGLHYYLNYSARRRPMAGVEVAYFTHIEQDEGARNRFFEVAAAVDHCVCHAELYAQALREHGIANVSVISPGIDLERFHPVLKVGVVGRTYDSGRKGEALVDAVRDIAGIEWHFTGQGWPEPAREIADEDMPAFYNEMDVILVPSLYEGGPMAVAEAVACGTTVIAPPVGWVKEFPHRSFKAGDAKDLRRVLEAAVAGQNAHRSKVSSRSWDGWVTGHDKLFRKLLADRDLKPVRIAPPLPGPVALALHGGELAAGGGPSVRVPRTADALQALGVDASTLVFPDPAIERAGLVHGFNLWQPDRALALARYVTARGKPFVFSPIYLDQREHRLWNNLIPDALGNARSPDEVVERLAAARSAFHRGAGDGAIQAMPGYDAATRALVDLADGVIYLSEHERMLLDGIGARTANGHVVRNPVDADRFAGADRNAFGAMLGISDYVLCVGRLEPRKNQAMLLQALREANVPVVLLGAASDRGYSRVVEAVETANVHLAGRIDPADPMLAAAYAGARVVVQPSWAEGAPLVALEAAAAGTSLVLSDRSSEREYFGELARYCDPADLTSIRDAVLSAFEAPHGEGDRAALQDFVRERHAYDRHARETLTVYQSTWATHRPRTVPSPKADPGAASATIVYDLTDLANRRGANLTTRAVREIAEALIASKVDVRLIAWHRADRRFVSVDPSMLGQPLSTYVDFASRAGLIPSDLPLGARLLVVGDEWTRDGRYVSDLAALAGHHGLALSLYLHTSQYLERSHRLATLDAPGKVLATMIAASGIVVVPSPGVAAELERYATERGVAPVRTALVRPGNRFVAASVASVPDGTRPLPAEPFTLAVAIDGIGEDEHLLARVWKRVAREARNEPLLVVATPATGPAITEWAAGLRSSGIEIRDSVSEAELHALYAAATIVVASPGTGRAGARVLAEAVARGKIAVGPRTPATEDAVGDAADLIDPIDLARWSARLAYYLRSRAARAAGSAQVAGGTITEWTDTAQGLLAATTGRFAPRGAYTVGIKARLTDRPGNLRKRTGWHRSESWGCWSAARTASFDFVLPEPAQGALTLCLELRSPLTARQENVCEVVVNGVAASRVILRGSEWRFFTVPIPAAAIKGHSIIEVEVRGTRLIELSKVFASEKPGRRGGFALAVAALVDPAQYANFEDYPTFRESLRGAIGFGEDIDLVRDRRAPTMLPERSVIGSDWGARHVDYRPQLLIKPLGRRNEALSMTLRYRAVASSRRPIEAMVTTREGVFLGTISASDDAIHETVLRIPANANVQPLLIEFLGAPSASPHRTGVGLTDNAFGIGFFGLRIDAGDTPAAPLRPVGEPYTVGTLLTFGSYDSDLLAEPAAPFIEPATWHDREPTGVWSQDGGGHLALRLDARPAEALHVRIDASCALDQSGPVTAEIRVGNVLVHSERRHDDQPFGMEFRLDPELVGPDGTVAFDIGTDRMVVPSRAGAWIDDRRLGLFVRSLMIAESALALRGSTPFAYGQIGYLPESEPEEPLIETIDEREERETAEARDAEAETDDEEVADAAESAIDAPAGATATSEAELPSDDGLPDAVDEETTADEDEENDAPGEEELSAAGDENASVALDPVASQSANDEEAVADEDDGSDDEAPGEELAVAVARHAASDETEDAETEDAEVEDAEAEDNPADQDDEDEEEAVGSDDTDNSATTPETHP